MVKNGLEQQWLMIDNMSEKWLMRVVTATKSFNKGPSKGITSTNQQQYVVVQLAMVPTSTTLVDDHYEQGNHR